MLSDQLIWNPATAGGYGVAGAGINPHFSAISHMASTWAPNIRGPVSYTDMLGNSRWAFPTVLETANRQAQRQLSVSITDGNLINAIWETIETGGAIVFTFNKSSILNGVFALRLRVMQENSVIIASTTSEKIACCPGDPRQQILWNSTRADEWFNETRDRIDTFFKDIRNNYKPDPRAVEEGVEFFLEKGLDRNSILRYFRHIIPLVVPHPEKEPIVESKTDKLKST